MSCKKCKCNPCCCVIITERGKKGDKGDKGAMGLQGLPGPVTAFSESSVIDQQITNADGLTALTGCQLTLPTGVWLVIFEGTYATFSSVGVTFSDVVEFNCDIYQSAVPVASSTREFGILRGEAGANTHNGMTSNAIVTVVLPSELITVRVLVNTLGLNGTIVAEGRSLSAIKIP